MAITIITQPSQWARVADTNRMTYKFSSDKYTEPNFQFQFYMLSFNVATNDYVELGYYNLHATPQGEVEFNPSAIYANYLSYDLDISITGLTEMVNGAHKFQLYCYEYYGTPPTRKTSTLVYTDILFVYNAAQQNIPYDYTPLNSEGNLKWVMSSISGQTGQFLTDATEFKLSNDDYGYLYALGEHYNSGRPNKIKYTIAYTPQGTSGTTTTMKFLNENIYYYNTTLLTSGTTYTIVSGYAEVWENSTTYTGNLSSPFTWDTNWVGGSGNTSIVKFKNCWMSYSIPYYSNQYNTNTIKKDLPSYEQSVANPSQKVKSQTQPYLAQDLFQDENLIIKTLPAGGFYSLDQGLLYWVAVFPDGAQYNYVHRIGDGDPLPTPDGYIQYDNIQSITGEYISTDYPLVIRYDTGITLKYDLQSIGYYIPVGPKNQPPNILSGLTDNWVYYDIDLVYTSGVTETKLNTYPIRIYKNCYSDKYDKWQLFWLNPHGGFDTYIFNKKVQIDYKIKKSTYKQKTPPTFSPYTAGEKVFNVNVDEEITLTSDLLSQKESQLLIQLTQSPVVYALKYYEYNERKTYFVVPYIITNETVKYEQKINDKEIFVEITLRSANSKIIQKN